MKTALITGCNGGLGKTLLKSFAEKGYNVIACVFPESQEFSDYCKNIESDYGIKIKQLFFNSTDYESLNAGLSEIESYEETIDVLVNNAGIVLMKPLLYTEMEDLHKVFAINYFATVMVTKKVAEKMIRQEGGVIVNISSAGSLGHQPGGACYDASKAAINQFTRTAAQELAPFGIRVNAIAPGPMRTAMFDSLPEKAQKNLVKSSAIKRAVEPEEIAAIAVFLVSEKTSFITGQIIGVDGGAII